MSATVIEFPRKDRRKDLVIVPTARGFDVAIAPEESQEERAFAQTFPTASAARLWAEEVLATWGNVFASVVDLTDTGGAA